jgi:hypothetical protein
MKYIAIAAAVLACSHAISIKWTGYGNDNQWTNKVNWNPDQVPGTGDDVTISSGVVQVTIATGVNSLVMGDSFTAPANVTFFQSFFVGSGGMQVQGNGNVFINAGTASMTGSITIGGNLFFQSGQISGQWDITSRGTVDMSGDAEKVLSGCQLTSSASSFVLSGVLVLNQSSQVVLNTPATLENSISIQSQDSSSVLFDGSATTITYTGNGEFQMMAPIKLGHFVFQGGNITVYDSITFTQSLPIPSGSYVSTVGSAVSDFSAGLNGAGVFSAAGATTKVGNVTMSGSFNVVGGNVTFSSSGSSIATLSISGGYSIFIHSVSATQLNLMSGNTVGPGSLSASSLQYSTPGFNLNNALSVSNSASMGGLLAFGGSGSLTFQSTCNVSLVSSMTFTGAAGPTVTNNGVIATTSPLSFQNINLGGSGEVDVSSTLSFQSATITQATISLAGSGIFKGASTMITMVNAVKAPSVVHAIIGSYSMNCPKECDSVSTSTIPSDNFHFSA